MALTVDSTTKVIGGIGGHAHAKTMRVDLGVYATSGVTVTAALLGVGKIVDILVFPSIGYTGEYNATTGKILVYSTAATEVANAVDLAAASFPLLVIYQP